MLLFIKSKIDDSTLKKISEDLEGYIKIVVDVSQGVMTAGGIKHVDGEQLLLKNRSKQDDLWGGGIDLETKEIDFDSMINIRPNQGNSSREVLSLELRDKIKEVASRLLSINL